ncbi:MAG: Ig-like domain-containing protein, partial [Bacillota bacterium]
YKGTPSGDDIDAIENYLKQRYSTPIVLGDIERLIDMEMEIAVGTGYQLPSMVLADMVGNYQKYVSVEWSGTYDVNVPGVYRLTGKALADPTKKMTLTLTVLSQ